MTGFLSNTKRLASVALPPDARHAGFLRASPPQHPQHTAQVLYGRPRGADGIVCEATSSSGRPFEDFASSARSGARQAGTAALQKMKLAIDVVDFNVKRTASQVNAKFDVTGKAHQAANQVSEQAKVMESRVGVKRRLRNLFDDLQRKWPRWQKWYAEFSKTPAGRVVFFAFVMYLFYSGLVFRILNFLFILWWLAPFFLVPFTRYFNRKAEQDMRRQATARQQAARAQQNAFFSNPFFTARQRPPPQQQGSPRRYGDFGGGGPVIDVEYESIDDK